MAKTDLVSRLNLRKRKIDKTFSSFDVIRIACLNLNRTELRTVIFFFMIGVPVILAAEQLELLFLAIKVPKTIIRVFEFFLKNFIGDQILEILLKIGLNLSVGDIAVLKRIVKRLQAMFPR